MVLVDTSVWIRFLAGKEPFARELDGLLEQEEVLRHDLIFGELLIGDRSRRTELLASYGELPRVETIDHSEVVELVRARRLSGRGIGWTDAHLLASALVSKCVLWTADVRLANVADELGLGR